MSRPAATFCPYSHAVEEATSVLAALGVEEPALSRDKKFVAWLSHEAVPNSPLKTKAPAFPRTSVDKHWATNEHSVSACQDSGNLGWMALCGADGKKPSVL